MIPYTTERRPDTGVSNVTMGFWLFIASEVMLFGALFSSYALLRVSAPDWPRGMDQLNLTLGSANTVLLMVLTAVAWRAGRVSVRAARPWMLTASALAVAFVAIKTLEYVGAWKTGHRPSTSTFMAMYFTLTGIHAAHVIGGLVANLWALAGAGAVGEALTLARLRVISHYWVFVDLVWIAIFATLYLS